MSILKKRRNPKIFGAIWKNLVFAAWHENFEAFGISRYVFWILVLECHDCFQDLMDQWIGQVRIIKLYIPKKLKLNLKKAHWKKKMYKPPILGGSMLVFGCNPLVSLSSSWKNIAPSYHIMSIYNELRYQAFIKIYTYIYIFNLFPNDFWVPLILTYLSHLWDLRKNSGSPSILSSPTKALVPVAVLNPSPGRVPAHAADIIYPYGCFQK